MKKLFKNKKKLVLFVALFAVLAVACTPVVDPETKKTLEKFIIYPDTPFSQVMSEGWFEGLFVWPLAQAINFVGSFTKDAGIAILIVTIVINLLLSVFSVKSQIQTQKMQMIQPEMQKIQKKYEGKTDEQSKMRQAQEMQALYKKYELNPFSSLIGMFIQLPLLMAVYYAVQRSVEVINGTFLGIDLTITPLNGMKEMKIAYAVIFVLMVGSQYLAMKVPAWLAKRNKKKSGVKTKEYAQDKQAGPDQMKMMTLFSTAMMAFLGLTWPTAMAYYWAIGSIFRIVQSIVIDKYFI